VKDLGSVWLVARREISVRGRSTGYRVGLAVTVLLVIVVAALPRLFGGPDSFTVGLAGAQSDALAAALGAQAEARDDLEITVVRYGDEAEARAGVGAGEVEAAVVDNAKVIVETTLDGDLSVILDTAHRAVATEENLRAAGLDPGVVQQAMRTAALTEVSLSGAGEDTGPRRVIATAIVVLLFVLIIQACSMVAMGVVEEKGSRIVEILLVAIRPAQLLAGKAIGLGVLGLHRISLGVYDFNPRAQASYAKLGFVLEGRLRDALFWDGEWHDELIMSVLATDPRP